MLHRLGKDSMNAKLLDERPVSGGSTTVEIPYEKSPDGVYYTTPVVIDTNTNNLPNFITDLFLQTPENKRNPRIFSEALSEAFRSVEVEKGQKDIMSKLEQLKDSVDKLGVRLVRSPEETQKPGQAPQPERQVCCEYGLDIVYVYTDIIKPRIIGDIEARYLRIIPVKRNERIIRFQNIEYCPVEQHYIESISILVTNGQGVPIKFKDNIMPTYLVLHFKRV